MSPRLRSLLCVLVLTPAAAWAWGFDGHRKLASNLDEPFPNGSCLRGWLATVTGTYSWYNHATDPDTWRSTDPNEWPRHYLNIDYADPISSYPRDWTAAQAQFGQYADDNGEVPWRVEEMYAQLVTKMKAKDSQGALLTVAHLSHYVTDAFSPMHDTKNQPGDCSPPTGVQKCLHLRYESDMLSVASQITEITNLSRQYYGTLGKADPRNFTFDAVIAGNPVGLKLISDDTKNNGDMTALFQNSKDLTARRWGDAVTMMGSLIGTAWVEAGKPTLSGMPSGCDTTVAQGDMQLKGFPLPPPQMNPTDAGMPETDAGSNVDPLGDPDGGNGGGLVDAGNVQTPQLADTCQGCGGGTAAAILPVVFFGVVLPRRRKS